MCLVVFNLFPVYVYMSVLLCVLVKLYVMACSKLRSNVPVKKTYFRFDDFIECYVSNKFGSLDVKSNSIKKKKRS